MKFRLTIATSLALAGLFLSAYASAAGGCPVSADRLQNFAGCVVQGHGGAMLRNAAGNGSMDGDHRELLNSMNQNSGVPPTVMPTSAGIIYPGWGPYVYASYGASPYYYAANSIYFGMNPYFWAYFGGARY